MLARRNRVLLGGRTVGGQGAYKIGDVIRFGSSFGAALAVEDDIPGDADEPDAMVADFAELFSMPENAEEGFLHGVFRLGGISGDGVGYAVESIGILGDERGDGLAGVGFNDRLRGCGREDGIHMHPANELSFQGTHSLKTKTVEIWVPLITMFCHCASGLQVAAYEDYRPVIRSLECWHTEVAMSRLWVDLNCRRFTTMHGFQVSCET